MEIRQTKVLNNQCYISGWWEGELVASTMDDCPTYESNIGLFIAGKCDGWIIDGQVRNFSYVKK